MEQAVISLDNQEDFDYIAKATGQQSFDNDKAIGYLRINTKPVDKAGNTLIPGTFEVNAPGVGLIYSKAVKFRPFLRGYQYSKWDKKEQKVASESRIIMSWSEEPIDTTGTIRCGRPKKDKSIKPEDLPPIFKEVKTYMVVWGLVTFPKEGTINVVGKPVKESHTVPVQFRITGGNYKVFDDFINQLTQRRRQMIWTELDLGLKLQVNGSVVYTELIIQSDVSSPLVTHADDKQTLREFVKHLPYINSKIDEQYRAALEKKSKGEVRTTDAAITVRQVQDSLAADVEDYMPAGEDPKDIPVVTKGKKSTRTASDYVMAG